MFTKTEIIARRQDEITSAQKQNGDIPKAGVNLALLILSSALYEQKQWSGEDYGEHPIRVAFNNTNSTPKQIIGILHDVVEDSDWTIDDLRTCGFSERVINGVDGMTRRKNEKYLDFVERCSQNEDSLDKKIEDLSHNSLRIRAPFLMDDRTTEKQNLYIIAYYYLVAIKKGSLLSGAPVSDLSKIHPNLFADQALITKHSSHGTVKKSVNTPKNPAP